MNINLFVPLYITFFQFIKHCYRQNKREKHDFGLKTMTNEKIHNLLVESGSGPKVYNAFTGAFANENTQIESGNMFYCVGVVGRVV